MVEYELRLEQQYYFCSSLNEIPGMMLKIFIMFRAKRFRENEDLTQIILCKKNEFDRLRHGTAKWRVFPLYSLWLIYKLLYIIVFVCVLLVLEQIQKT